MRVFLVALLLFGGANAAVVQVEAKLFAELSR